MVPCVGCWWGWLGSEPNAGASTAYLDGTPVGDRDGIGVAAAMAAFYAAVSSDDDDDTDGTNGGDTQALRRRFSLIAKVCSPHTPPTAPPMLPHRPDHTLFGFVCSCTSSRVQRLRRLKDTRTLSLSLSRCCLCMYLHPLCCVALPHPSPASLIRNCRNTNGKPCARTSRAGCKRWLRCRPSWQWLREKQLLAILQYFKGVVANVVPATNVYVGGHLWRGGKHKAALSLLCLGIAVGAMIPDDTTAEAQECLGLVYDAVCGGQPRLTREAFTASNQ